ncbi:MAG: sugar phosphate isomerase/epimerase [Deltaproteobacteria bacterium]|nr:sugar phosphate isomerase/epimerase [Deltaproteobacteria bacterium]MBW2218817.1 sugar phosphate isomerase/epimerase [Deltaproteobacteria bacterium]
MIQKVQVNVPFRMLWETYLDKFMEYNLDPEIGIDADALDNFSFSDFKKIAKKFKDKERRITFHGPFIDLSPGSNDPEIRRVTKNRLKQVLELVPLFEPVTVVCHAGYDESRYGFFQEEWMEKSLEMWSWFGIRLGREGTGLMLENVYESGPDEILTLFESLEKDNVAFCLDPGHTFVFGETPLESWIKVLGKYIGQIHLHDNNSKKDEHLALGTGNIDFQPVFEFLKYDKENRTVITLEPHDEASLWPSLEFLEKFIPEY